MPLGLGTCKHHPLSQDTGAYRRGAAAARGPVSLLQISSITQRDGALSRVTKRNDIGMT